jgi:hypothetical protein
VAEAVDAAELAVQAARRQPTGDLIAAQPAGEELLAADHAPLARRDLMG